MDKVKIYQKAICLLLEMLEEEHMDASETAKKEVNKKLSELYGATIDFDAIINKIGWFE